MEINNTNTGNKTMKNVIENTAALLETYNCGIELGMSPADAEWEIQREFNLSDDEAEYAVCRIFALNNCRAGWVAKCDRAADAGIGKQKRVKMENGNVVFGKITSAYFAGVKNNGVALFTCVLTSPNGTEHKTTFTKI